MLGPKVVYGGTVPEATRQPGDEEKTVFLSPTEEKLDAFLNFPTPTCKKEIQSICGMSTQMKRWTPGFMLEFPGLQRLCAANIPFTWNSDLQDELNAMKRCIKEHVKLSPLDTFKDLVLWIDAAPLQRPPG